MSTSEIMSHSAFPQFLSLPKELQVQIWNYTLLDVEHSQSHKLPDLKLYGFAQAQRPQMILLGFEGLRNPYRRDPGIYIGKLSATIWINKRPSYELCHLFHVMQVCHSVRQTAIAYWRRRVSQAKIAGRTESMRLKGKELQKAIVDVLGDLLEHTQS